MLLPLSITSVVFIVPIGPDQVHFLAPMGLTAHIPCPLANITELIPHNTHFNPENGNTMFVRKE
jgi:hypothetical protein